jgi:hypothetical protein
MSNHRFKILIVLLALFTTSAVWIPRQYSIAHARAELAAQQIAVKARIDAATTDLESTRRELRTQTATRKQTEADVKKVAIQLENMEQDSRHLTPPPNLPEWNNDSPYVWLRKEMLPKLLAQQPLLSFASTGAINDHAASLLMLDEKDRTTVNSKLMRALGDYQAIEFAKAETTTEQLPEGTKVTVHVPPQPEQGAPLEEQFKTALRTELGAQRADILIQSDQSWLDHQFSQAGSFSQAGAEPKTISVLRRSDGNYSFNLSFDTSKGPINTFSTSGPWPTIKSHIPAHLRSLFDPIAPPPAKL